MFVLGASLLAGCATVSESPVNVEPPASKAVLQQAQINIQMPAAKRYKRKIAIARFSNESNYGRALMTDQDYDRIGKQASDMLASKLIKSNKFVVFERTDLNKVIKEQSISGDAGLIGVDALIIGSVTEFGRSITGKSGFLSSTKVQTARAKVDARIVDVKTGQAFFSATGAGEANTESGEIAGYGSQADYDATLNDRAISAAISDMIDKLVSSLDERPWKTDVLEEQGGQVFISGGKEQGLKVGDLLQVMEKGAIVKSKQSGFVINLPSKKVATVKVTAFFGDNENNEGSVCEVLTGNINPAAIKNVYVEEIK
ncbi:curli production assembly protein CsgG [Oryzomonas rubra]|uniref:Curli production assembly protein CsgG n=2 Tax=Oryzomonas rubra TaxID=2509454 RepID=A0A5A9XN25_9BACT|nr:curli production assembly protein CsgG [Oryzomonas rubra]